MLTHIYPKYPLPGTIYPPLLFKCLKFPQARNAHRRPIEFQIKNASDPVSRMLKLTENRGVVTGGFAGVTSRQVGSTPNKRGSSHNLTYLLISYIELQVTQKFKHPAP